MVTALKPLDKENLTCVRLGSSDSTDIDNLYIVEQMPTFQECKSFCDQKEDNRNVAVVENGVIRDCYKGSPDELNNSVHSTYPLHNQRFPSPVLRPIGRNAPLKAIRASRIILSHLLKGSYREGAKKALHSGNFWERREFLRTPDFSKLDLSPEALKSISFQLGQTNALMQGNELYTKSALAEIYPELQPFLYRKEGDAGRINEFRDRFLELTRLVYVRQKGPLNLFCFMNGPGIDFKSTKNWNMFARQSRGMIIDIDRERCLYWPFDKFFRVNEVPENDESVIPRDNPEIVEKIDGSMVSCFRHNGEITFACKGNFDVNTSRRAEEVAKKYQLGQLDFDKYSHVFELIYPENNFPQGLSVVNYGNLEALVLVGLRDRLTNEMLPYSEVERVAREKGLPYPTRDKRDLDEVLADTKTDADRNREGFVARLSNGRFVKIKYDSYMKTLTLANDLRSDRFVTEYIRAKSPKREHMLDNIPGNVLQVAHSHLSTFDRVYRGLEDHMQTLVHEKGSEFPSYVLENVPPMLQQPLLRYWRGGSYKHLLEKAALKVYQQGGILK